MSRRMLCSLVALTGLVAWQAGAQAPAAEKPKYVGVENCGMCHKSAAKGNQFGQWQGTKHAQAYALLATPQAKEIGAKKGIADPQKSDQCLKCHVTAHGVDASLIQAAAEGKKGYRVEDGVGCETCHGPGSLYKAMAVMKDHQAAMAKGLVMPDENLCKKCHNPESPTHKPFVYAEMVKRIAHPMPEAAPAGGAR